MSFYVIYRDDAPEYNLRVSQRQFPTRAEAEAYLGPIAPSRNPIIAEGPECERPVPPENAGGPT